MIIWEYLMNFFLYTIGMVALIYLAYFYIRVNNPGLGGPLGNQQKPGGPPLRIESSLDLEPRKRLYVVTYGQQRFLVSSTVEKVELLSTLQEEPVPEIPEIEVSGLQTAVPFTPPNGFMERLRYSIKMVLSDRFPGLGGK